MWHPTPEAVAAAQMTAFKQFVLRHYSEAFQQQDPLLLSQESFHRWSCEQPEEFWSAVWEFFAVIGERGSGPVLRRDPEGPPPFARWFEDARLNFAENLLRRRDETEAIVFCGEDGTRRALTFREVAEQASAVSRFLTQCGVKAGDRVGGYLPNLPESVVCMLGAAAIGAIWSSTSPDFGPEAVIERFEQIAPRVLFTADGYRYNGKQISLRDKVSQIVRRAPTIQKVVVIRYTGDEVDGTHTPYEALLGISGEDLPYHRFPFNHPLYILYSSGTTGAPKCITHGAGGTLLQHLKELALHTDVRAGERIFYFTTCGWMMWNWLVSSLALGATVVLYDGSPFFPTATKLLELVERERVSVFGTSAKYLLALEKAAPQTLPPLTDLRAVLSTGSPLAPQSFDFVYHRLKSSVQLSSISGGTDIISCFMIGNPTEPVYRGEIQGPGLGMDVSFFDSAGREVVGEPGELVCKSPAPSMPVCFWNDPTGERYRNAYFATFPGVWRHGDWGERTARGTFVLYGRSDTVLNPGGVRIGTAEIYRAVEPLTEVVECVAIGQQWENDERIVLFVRLREGTQLDARLETSIRTAIRERNTPRHVPAVILAVADIPKTMNGKISEIAVKNVVHNRRGENLHALLNPESLEYFRNREELRDPHDA